MMAISESGARACKYCGKKFKPVNKRQIYCKNVACFKKRRSEYMRKYMVEWKKRHPTYWKTPEQREYLKKWRLSHPDYFKNYRKKRGK